MHDPRRGVVAEVPQRDCGRGVDWAEQPEDDDGEEAADAEDDEDAAGVDDGAHQQQQAEEDEDAWRKKSGFKWESNVEFLEIRIRKKWSAS